MKSSSLCRIVAMGLALLGLGSTTVLSGAEDPVVVDRHKLFEEARQLHRDGDDRAAFLQFMRLDGGDAVAISVVRSGGKVREFLDLLREGESALPASQFKLVEGELLLSIGDKAGALKSYRQAVSLIEDRIGGASRHGLLPEDGYFVDSESELNWVPSFTAGPGSHRDNRLIRRFIALEAWEDADREFARVWELHREAAQPYVMQVQLWDHYFDRPANALHAENVNPIIPEPKFEKQLFRPAGFNGRGLQFALDYAYFLQRQKKT